MKTLFWIPPWFAHGDPFFFQNCLRKHLIPQANLLAGVGFQVDLVLPELMAGARALIDSRIRVIDLDAAACLTLGAGRADPSVTLYQQPEHGLTQHIQAGLRSMLAEAYDCILLWETPVPFLERMYPDALIVHQMPGAFSRAPYPHTVTFDPQGLFRHGTLFTEADTIRNQPSGSEIRELVETFKQISRSTMAELQPFRRRDLDASGRWKSLQLVPLQVSAHYAFMADTGFGSQAEFLLHVLNRADPEAGLVVTQYITPKIQDAILTPELSTQLRSRWPNLIHRPEFDRIPGISQYLTSLVDEVVTCSSSVALQAMVWHRRLRVIQPTFLAPHASGTEPFDVLQREQDATLGFMLGRHQVLARRVVEDAGFLTALLEELVARRRAGRTGIDALVPFHQIDPDYNQDLMVRFNAGRAAKDLGGGNESFAAAHRERSRFTKACAEPGIKAISFDVFDTLLRRPTETPADLYRFLDPAAARVADGRVEDFSRIRLQAELQVRESSTQGEITLEEIYGHIGSQYGIDAVTLQRLQDLEISTELQCIEARETGRRLWDIARASGRAIHLISDMYLPQSVLEAMLAKAGYEGWKTLFVSSTHRVRKKEGGLFDIVLQQLGLAPSELLHVGDNKVADVEQPALRGIKTFRISRALDRMRGNSLYANIYPARQGAGEKARSAIAGLTAMTLFERPSGELEKTSHFQGSAYQMGYAALGPVIAGFMLWLGRQAQRDGISHLHFLSREGWLLRQVYDALHLDDGQAPPSSYLYASRRATRVANLRQRADIIALAGQPYRGGTTLGKLLSSRFGLSVQDPDLAQVMQEFGYDGLEATLSAEADCKARFTQLCLRLDTRILQVASEEREAYLSYLQSTSIAIQPRPAVVDLGWKANMQGALGQLLGRPLDGYYYATLQDAQTWLERGHLLRAYAGDFLSAAQPGCVVSNRHLLEFMVCHVEPSLVRMQQSARGMLPVFREEDGLGTRRILIEEIHRGAIQFAHDLRTHFGTLRSQIWIDPALAERTLASFISTPHAADAGLFSGHSFEDAMGGVDRQYIVAPEPTAAPSASVWKAGAAVLSRPRAAAAAPRTKTKAGAHAAIVAPQTSAPASTGNEEPRPEMSMWLRRMEAHLIQHITSERKLNKYLRDRESFFADSSNPLARTWIRIVK